jgi:exopolysaccharide biosynthesis polyprenyl glycosylphosphotransferase
VLLRQAGLVVRSCTLGFLPLFLFPLLSVSGAFRLSTVFLFWLAAIFVETSGRTAITLLARYLAKRAAGQTAVVIVGSGPRALRLLRSIESQRPTPYHVVGFVDSPGPHQQAGDICQRMLGDLPDLEDILARRHVDKVLITLPVKSCYEQIQGAIDACQRLGVEAQYLTDLFSSSRAASFERTHGIPFLRLTRVSDDYRVVIKRLFDVTIAATALVLASPLLAVVAAAIYVVDGSPVLFSQPRYGYNRRLFRMYKFRTMVVDAESLQSGLEDQNEAAGPVFKIQRDPRITPLGRFLRRTSLDELPQLWNVLKGDMAVVGPRPLPVRDVSRFSEARLLRRFSVRPGLTCLWQISGRSNLPFEHWIELDLEYIDNWSLALDLQIVLRTVPTVVVGSGAA